MSNENRVKHAVTVRTPLVEELFGPPGPEPVRWERPSPDPAKPGYCPVCDRRVVTTRLEEHLGCYDPDATCSTTEVAAWLGVGPALP
ncbi:MAG: hypothetical protein ACKV2O_14975 [Acidimicrobiales bacterium]